MESNIYKLKFLTEDDNIKMLSEIQDHWENYKYHSLESRADHAGIIKTDVKEYYERLKKKNYDKWRKEYGETFGEVSESSSLDGGNIEGGNRGIRGNVRPEESSSSLNNSTESTSRGGERETGNLLGDIPGQISGLSKIDLNESVKNLETDVPFTEDMASRVRKVFVSLWSRIFINCKLKLSYKAFNS